jgi:predicted DCC family thiol-disulfide oxidoreductase YuxK
MPNTASNRALVLFDGDCPMCRKTSALIKRFDWRQRLEFHNCRDATGIPPHTAHLDPARMIAEMHVLTPDRTAALSGFRAVRYVAGRVPLLWPLYPLLFLPGMSRLGQRIYLWVARNRFHLVPCHDGVCSMKFRVSSSEFRVESPVFNSKLETRNSKLEGEHNDTAVR